MGLKGTPAPKKILIAGCVDGILCQIISIGYAIDRMRAAMKISEFMANSKLDVEMEAAVNITQGIAVGAGVFGMMICKNVLK